MSYPTTYTQSQTHTYSEARANEVTGKIYEDLLNLMIRGLITKETADRIRQDLLFLQGLKALDYVEFQFRNTGGTIIGGLHYKLEAYDFIYSNDDSGGVNFWGLPSSTKVNFLFSLDRTSSKIGEADEYTKNWGTGSKLEGTETHLKSYSKDGYGFNQSKIGSW